MHSHRSFHLPQFFFVILLFITKLSTITILLSGASSGIRAFTPRLGPGKLFKQGFLFPNYISPISRFGRTAMDSSSQSNRDNISDSATVLHTKSTSTFASYLSDIPSNLDARIPSSLEDETVFNVIIGNEAGDADSIISSLTLSYVNSIIDKKPDTATFSLPLASILRGDMALRRDVILLLQLAGIDHENIMYLDSDALKSILNEGANGMMKNSVTVTLVDHNKLRNDLWPLLNENVVEILDHHQDEGSHGSVIGEMRNVAFRDQAALVGSTCTLVTERLMGSVLTNDHGDGDVPMSIDAGLGLTLLGVILLDTMNMKPDAGKGTARDQDAIDFLIRYTQWDKLELEGDVKLKIYGEQQNQQREIPSRSLLYEYLRDSKFDESFWKDMSARDALRIDYKRFEGEGGPFGLSSVLLPTNVLISKELFFKSALNYMEEAGINLLGVLSMVIVDDQPQRELLLVGASERVKTMTDHLLNDDAASFLQISRVNGSEVDLANGMAAVELKQGNPKGSRKQIAPAMLTIK